MMNTVGFPELGIGPFDITSTAFTAGSLKVQWYGLIIVLGMILACAYAFHRMKELGLILDNMLDIAIVCIPCGIIGARLYYVLTSLDEYHSLYEAIAIWNGGIAIYGGIIGGLLGVIAVCLWRKYNILAILDCIAPGVMIGQMVGRWGNFVNAEAYGIVGPYDFLGMKFDAMSIAANNPFIMTINGEYVHPTFLYESVWNFVGFLIINALWKKKKYNGQIMIMYLTWYGLGRSIIEGFRGDSLYIGMFRISQLLAFICFVAGVVLLIVFGIMTAGKKPLVTKHTAIERKDGKMAVRMDGKALSAKLREQIKREAAELEKKTGIKPGLAVIIVGSDPASQIYVRNKGKACEEVGFKSEIYELPEKTTEKELLELVHKLNKRDDIHGILAQSPLPKHLDESLIVNNISPDKDVDAFHPVNVGKIMIGDYSFLPCTPAGVMELLKEYNINPEGKKCVVVGRSDIVGKPMAMLLLHANGTVTVCHSRTKDLAEVTREADIVVMAIGKADFLKGDMIKEGAVVIDVGMNRNAEGKLTGDVDFAECEAKASYITPVPGGVGPMTITMLMKNTLTSAKNVAEKKAAKKAEKADKKNDKKSAKKSKKKSK